MNWKVLFIGFCFSFCLTTVSFLTDPVTMTRPYVAATIVLFFLFLAAMYPPQSQPSENIDSPGDAP